MQYLVANGLRRDAHDFFEHGDERNNEDDSDDDSLPELIEIEDLISYEEPSPGRAPAVRAKMAIENIPYVLLREEDRIL